MPKLNRYNDGGFVYGQWREVSRRVDPVTGDIIITERRDGSKDVRYNERGVSWRKGYEDWLAAGNEGTMEDFRLEAEAWKRAQDRKEFDSQNRERRIKRKEEVEGDDEGKPSDDLRPDGFVGDGPGGGGPDEGGGSGDVSRPDKYDNVSRPRRPGDVNIPDVSIRPKLPVGIYTGDNEYTIAVPYPESQVRRMMESGVLPSPEISQSPEQRGEVLIEDNKSVGEVLPDTYVDSEYVRDMQSRDRMGKEKTRGVYSDNIRIIRDDGSATINTRQVDRTKKGRPDRSRGKSIYQEFDSEGNRILREVDRFDKGGLVSKNNNNHTDMYSTKQMGMGGKNMPKLMKKGGKSSFPDLNNDGKVSFADILAGRLRKKKKKSMDNGGQVVRTERPGRMSPLPRKGVVFAGSEDPVSRETAASIARFGRGRALDSAIQVPQLVYGRDSQGNMDPDLYGEMSPEEFARLRARGVEIGADIEDFADDLVREGQQQQPIMSEDDPRFVRKVYNSGMGADEPIEFYYYDQDKGKELRLLPSSLIKDQRYGGKVKLMKKGGTVDYFAGGALAAGLGQFAQRSQNPLIQGIGKVASTVGGMTPGGKAVNMAANFLPAGLGALGQLMRGR